MTSYLTAKTLFAVPEGRSFAYREVGRSNGGVPLICFVHLSGTLDDWDPAVIDGLGRTRHVLTFDNTGIARSSGVTPTTIELQAKEALIFIRSFGFAKVDLLGFSMGGLIAQVIAHANPEFVRKLVLIGTGHVGDSTPATLSAAKINNAFAEAGKLAAEQGKHWKHFLFFSQSKRGQRAADAGVKRMAERTQDRDSSASDRSIGAQLEAIVTYRTMPRTSDFLPAIKQPTFVVNGDNDLLIATKHSFTLYNDIPNAQLAIFPDTGHGSFIEYHDEFVRQALDFLQTD